MSAFVRFEAGELFYTDDDGRSWGRLNREWICRTDGISVTPGRRTHPNAPADSVIELWVDNAPGALGMPMLWHGTSDALLARLNGFGPVGLDAARLSAVLQALLVELDAEQVKRAKPTGLAEVEPVVDSVEARAFARRDPAAGLSLEEAIEAGHALIERDGHTVVTWIRGGMERSVLVCAEPLWGPLPHNRTPWATVDRATMQHEEPALWAWAVNAWEQRPWWPVERAGEGAA